MTKRDRDSVRKPLTCCGFILFAIIINAAISTFAIADSKHLKQHAELDNVLAKQCRFSGTFRQEKSLKGLPVPLKSNGRFLFDCDLGLIWHTATPITETKIYTMASTHFQLDDKREIDALDDVIQTTIAKLLLDIMSANQEAITKNFKINSINPNSVSLTPNNTFLKKGIQSILLNKMPEKNTLMIELIDQQSQSTRIYSVETQKNESKLASLSNCQSLFKNEPTCDVFENPSSYEISPD